MGELAALFLKLGTIAFGGPAAHTAMMEDEVVRRRGWLTRDAFLDLVAATNLIPGPNSTELALHIGYQRAGGTGLLVAGVCFILPAVLIVMAAAWAYVRYGTLPEADALLYGVKPVIIAIVLHALIALTRTAVKTTTLAAVGLAALVLGASGVNELVLLLGAGVAAALIGGTRSAMSTAGALGAIGLTLPSGATAGTMTANPIAIDSIAAGSIAAGSIAAGSIAAGPIAAGPIAAGPVAANTVAGSVAQAAGATASVVAAAAATAAVGTGTVAVPVSLSSLFLFFLKVGSVLFGSGYVLLAFLRADLVERWGWLTNAQLLDAVAIGQVTPGPLFTTATFIGYLLAGPTGAVVATVGIFLPAFIFVALSGPIVPRLRRSPTAGALLDGVIVASLALMAVVTYQLARSALVDPMTIALAIIAALMLIRWRINSAWLVLAGALIGLAVRAIADAGAIG